MRQKLLGLIFLICFLFPSSFVLAEKTAPVSSSSAKEKSLKLFVGENSYDLSEQEIEDWARENNLLDYDPNYLSEIENVNFCSYKKSVSCKIYLELKKQDHIKKTSFRSYDEKLVKKYVEDLARKANRDPENAKLTMEEGRVSVFSLSRKGIILKEDESLNLLMNFLTSFEKPDSLNLPYSEKNPEVTIDSIENMGITTLIGEGRSNFRGSPKNRIFNIKVATSRFNGVLIKPGEDFSFVKVLGEVDGDHGYLPELVIKKDKTEPEFGGGICQVSTTAFRAAINSGLKITARRNHAYPVQYYNPQGMDATVYVPRPDLRFLNDTSNYILIQTKIEGTELIFDFYGTSDGRKVNIIGPKIIERNPDGSMKATFTQQVFDKDDKLLREDVFNSSYDSPSKYPHPGSSADVLTQKPNSWSDNEWKDYKKAHNL